MLVVSHLLRFTYLDLYQFAHPESIDQEHKLPQKILQPRQFLVQLLWNPKSSP